MTYFFFLCVNGVQGIHVDIFCLHLSKIYNRQVSPLSVVECAHVDSSPPLGPKFELELFLMNVLSVLIPATTCI